MFFNRWQKLSPLFFHKSESNLEEGLQDTTHPSLLLNQYCYTHNSPKLLHGTMNSQIMSIAQTLNTYVHQEDPIIVGSFQDSEFRMGIGCYGEYTEHLICKIFLGGIPPDPQTLPLLPAANVWERTRGKGRGFTVCIAYLYFSAQFEQPFQALISLHV